MISDGRGGGDVPGGGGGGPGAPGGPLHDDLCRDLARNVDSARRAVKEATGALAKALAGIKYGAALANFYGSGCR